MTSFGSVSSLRTCCARGSIFFSCSLHWWSRGRFVARLVSRFRSSSRLALVSPYVLAIPIARAQIVLDSVLEQLTTRCNCHPTAHERAWAKTKLDKRGASTTPEGPLPRPFEWPPIVWMAEDSRRGLIGYYVPLACVALLGFVALIEWLKCFGVIPKS